MQHFDGRQLVNTKKYRLTYQFAATAQKENTSYALFLAALFISAHNKFEFSQEKCIKDLPTILQFMEP